MENLKIPNHVGIIMDGNGRWATSRGLMRQVGHNKGAENLKKLSIYIINRGIKYLSVFAFSTENFKRSKEEVDHLMNIFIEWFQKEAKTYNKENIKLIFSGTKEPLQENVWKAMKELEKNTSKNTRGVINVCLNYGGKQEIIDATKKICADVKSNKINIEELNEELYNKYLYNDLPPIDFLIRTSGEQRISNFMLWQSAYAEFYFPEIHFPDFDCHKFEDAILEYTKRDRRFGGIK